MAKLSHIVLSVGISFLFACGESPFLPADSGISDTTFDATLDFTPNYVEPTHACKAGPEQRSLVFADEENDKLPFEELAARARFDRERITVWGRLIDEDNRPVTSATLNLGPFQTCSDDKGEFVFFGLLRRNRELLISADGFHREVRQLHLTRPVNEVNLHLRPFVMVRKKAKESRILFGGDFMMGRRFLDPTDMTPRDRIPVNNPDAPISVTSPEVASKRFVSYVKPLFQTADFPTINLESVVTLTPITPHIEKSYVYFTLPGSLDAITDLNVPYVTLGNNHTYDYLEKGIDDTEAHLRTKNIAFSGVGHENASAWRPYQFELKTLPYSIISANSIAGDRYPINYNAGPNKGGAADLRDTEIWQDTIRQEVDAGRFTIAVPHTGIEYTMEPTRYARSRFTKAIDAGALIAIGHHPHTAQGAGLHKGRLEIHSLGNFLFDSQRHETFLSILFQADIEGEQVERPRFYPIYIEDFGPRLIVGELADRFMRRIGEFSTPYGTDILMANQLGHIDRVGEGSGAGEVVHVVKNINVEIDESGSAIVDLRHHLPADHSLSAATFPTALQAQMGRDILIFGDFEETDTDEHIFEVARWDVSGRSSYPCLEDPFRGVASLCLRANNKQTKESVGAFRHRVRVWGNASDTPEKDITLLSYGKWKNVSKLYFQVRYAASEGERSFGIEEAINISGTSESWQPLSAELNLPPDLIKTGPEINPRAIQVWIRMQASKDLDSFASFDDVALITWQQNILSNEMMQTPHAQDFIRLSGAPGNYVVKIRGEKRNPPLTNLRP